MVSPEVHYAHLYPQYHSLCHLPRPQDISSLNTAHYKAYITADHPDNLMHEQDPQNTVNWGYNSPPD